MVSDWKAGASAGSGDHLAQDVVNVPVVFREAFGELIVLLRERPNVDAAQRVRLRERQRERELGRPARPGSRNLSAISNARGHLGERIRARFESLDGPVPVGGEPRHACDLVELVRIVDDHRLVVIVDHDL